MPPQTHLSSSHPDYVQLSTALPRRLDVEKPQGHACSGGLVCAMGLR